MVLLITLHLKIRLFLLYVSSSVVRRLTQKSGEKHYSMLSQRHQLVFKDNESKIMREKITHAALFTLLSTYLIPPLWEKIICFIYEENVHELHSIISCTCSLIFPFSSWLIKNHFRAVKHYIQCHNVTAIQRQPSSARGNRGWGTVSRRKASGELLPPALTSCEYEFCYYTNCVACCKKLSPEHSNVFVVRQNENGAAPKFSGWSFGVASRVHTLHVCEHCATECQRLRQQFSNNVKTLL